MLLVVRPGAPTSVLSLRSSRDALCSYSSFLLLGLESQEAAYQSLLHFLERNKALQERFRARGGCARKFRQGFERPGEEFWEVIGWW